MSGKSFVILSSLSSSASLSLSESIVDLRDKKAPGITAPAGEKGAEGSGEGEEMEEVGGSGVAWFPGQRCLSGDKILFR